MLRGPGVAKLWSQHPDDKDTNAEDDDEQLGKFFSSKGSVAILYLGLFCQFVNKALNFSVP